jgi:hypothetical protein
MHFERLDIICRNVPVEGQMIAKIGQQLFVNAHEFLCSWDGGYCLGTHLNAHFGSSCPITTRLTGNRLKSGEINPPDFERKTQPFFFGWLMNSFNP